MRLYESARDHGTWDARRDIDWTRPTVLQGQKEELAWGVASQAVYAEQVGLTTAAALLEGAEDLETRLCLAIQCSDEAKHSEVFARYALRSGGSIERPLTGVETLQATLHGLPTSHERFLVHTLLESVALDEFLILRDAFQGDLLHDIYGFVIKDEARHVAMGFAHIHRLLASHAWPSGDVAIRHYGNLSLELSGIDDVAIDWLADVAGHNPCSVKHWFEKRHRERLRRLASL
jgi:hypothetical protein